MINKFEFKSDLHLVRRIKGDGKLFEVDANYHVSFEMDGVKIDYTVLKGMPTDLASIPKIVPKWIAQKVDGHIEAAVVHDQLCKDRGPWSSKVAAEIFLAGMEAAGVGKIKRRTMYHAVKWFGPQWD